MRCPSLERQHLATIPFVGLVKLADCPLDVLAELGPSHAVLPLAASAVRGGENDRAFNLDVDVVDPNNCVRHSSKSSVVPMLRDHESSAVGKLESSLTRINNGLGAA